MKQLTAVRHLRGLLTSAQKLRSITAEEDLLSEDTASRMWPLIWGEKSIIPILAKVLDKYETSGELAPLDFYNIMVIATRLEPMLGIMAGMVMPDFPQKADINWLKGWTAP